MHPDSTRADTAAGAAPADTTLATDTTATDTTAIDTTAVARADSARVRHKPAGALLRSLLIPGWGQLRLGRKLTAAAFVAAEGVTLGMALKANADLRHLRAIGADSMTVNTQSQKREDWLVLVAVNHLLAGLEAFVTANLSDFPPELKLERGPHGFGASITLPVRVP